MAVFMYHNTSFSIDSFSVNFVSKPKFDRERIKQCKANKATILPLDTEFKHHFAVRHDELHEFSLQFYDLMNY